MGSYKCCQNATGESLHLDSLAKVLKIVTDPSRLRLLCVLKKGEHCVCDMMQHVTLSQSLISHHLRDLKDAGIVVDDRRGLRVYYALTKKGKQIIDLLFQMPITDTKQ